MTTITYIDTSLLVKRYVTESGSAELEARLIGEQPNLVISELVRAELISTLRRKERRAIMTRKGSHLAAQCFEQDIATGVLSLKSLNSVVVARAALLIGELKSPLATLDALHLATALLHNAMHFFTTDEQLSKAAREAGLIVWPEFPA
jgi:predicted nucleic acid-binding protein